jgi:hypothetical protein
MTRKLDELLNDALAAVDRAVGEAWRLPSGADATPQLEQLRHSLLAIQQSPTSARSGLTRWVTDWIPDVTHPLVTLVSQIEHLDAPA